MNRSFLASPDVLHGDDYQLQQAFVNLFLNALEAMGPNGTLSVATNLLPASVVPASLPETAKGTQLRLTIQDNGIGIPPENMARLFEPFFTTKPNGTGLGLLITRRIIQEHRGAITVESQPDKGTSFQITLPAGLIQSGAGVSPASCSGVSPPAPIASSDETPAEPPAGRQRPLVTGCVDGGRVSAATWALWAPARSAS